MKLFLFIALLSLDNNFGHGFVSPSRSVVRVAQTTPRHPFVKSSLTATSRSRSALFLANEPVEEEEKEKPPRSRLRKATGFSLRASRTSLRKVTGFSLTALRTSLRTATGISLTALRASAFTATSLYVRNTMAFVLEIFPAWLRYFFQPAMDVYFAILMWIRGPPRDVKKELDTRHDNIIKGYIEAVNMAREAQNGGYWPIRVTESGTFATVPNPDDPEAPVDFVDAIAKSVDFAMAKQYAPA